MSNSQPSSASFWDSAQAKSLLTPAFFESLRGLDAIGVLLECKRLGLLEALMRGGEPPPTCTSSEDEVRLFIASQVVCRYVSQTIRLFAHREQALHALLHQAEQDIHATHAQYLAVKQQREDVRRETLRVEAEIAHCDRVLKSHHHHNQQHHQHAHQQEDSESSYSSGEDSPWEDHQQRPHHPPAAAAGPPSHLRLAPHHPLASSSSMVMASPMNVNQHHHHGGGGSHAFFASHPHQHPHHPQAESLSSPKFGSTRSRASSESSTQGGWMSEDELVLFNTIGGGGGGGGGGSAWDKVRDALQQPHSPRSPLLSFTAAAAPSPSPTAHTVPSSSSLHHHHPPATPPPPQQPQPQPQHLRKPSSGTIKLEGINEVPIGDGEEEEEEEEEQEGY